MVTTLLSGRSRRLREGRDLNDTIYHRLGVKPVISAIGYATGLGGSYLSPDVRSAMEEANDALVNMADLLDAMGRTVAELLGAPAARITNGAAGALVLGAAACLAGENRDVIRRLPALVGPKRDILIQRRHRYKYDRCVEISGARLREVGDADFTSQDHLRDMIDETTAAILLPLHLEGAPGTLTLKELSAVSGQRDVPIIADAAALVYPLERMRRCASSADLVCFAAKYFGGPNSGGLLCGRRDLVASAAAQDFASFEFEGSQGIGRAMKLDRQLVIGTVVALREWLEMDHARRLRESKEKRDAIQACLRSVGGIAAEVETRDDGDDYLRLKIGPPAQHSAPTIQHSLRSGRPSIWIAVEGNDIIMSMAALQSGEERIVASRLIELFTESGE
jgi:L-seryl-tRNA(Ser) seleniumtransferase